MKAGYGEAAVLPRRVKGRQTRMERADRVLLGNVPSAILGSYPVTRFGLGVGMSHAAARWRGRLIAGEFVELEMRAAIVPVATLLSAMLEALLRAAPIDRRAEAFEWLADDSGRILTGRPQAVIVQSGIL